MFAYAIGELAVLARPRQLVVVVERRFSSSLDPRRNSYLVSRGPGAQSFRVFEHGLVPTDSSSK